MRDKEEFLRIKLSLTIYNNSNNMSVCDIVNASKGCISIDISAD